MVSVFYTSDLTMDLIDNLRLVEMYIYSLRRDDVRKRALMKGSSLSNKPSCLQLEMLVSHS